MSKFLKTFLFLAAASAAAGSALAALPFWFDIPPRDNPNDYVNRRGTQNLNPVLPTPTPVCGGVDASTWSFEGGTSQGWASETVPNGYVFMTLANDLATFCRGTQSLCGGFAFSHAGLDQKAAFKQGSIPYAGNLSGKALSVAVNFPPGLSNASVQAVAKIYVKATGAYSFSNGPFVSVPPAGGWMALGYDLSALAPASAADIREIGLEVYSSNGAPDGTFSVCIDAFDVNPKPSPTLTPTFDPSSPTATATPSATASATATAGTPSTTPSATQTQTPNPFTSTPTPTATPTPTVSGIVWNYDATEQGWQVDTSDTGFSAAAQGAAQVHDGAGSLALTTSLSAPGAASSGVVKVNMASLDLSTKTLTAWLYVPAGMSQAGTPNGAYLYVKTGAGYAWNAASWTNLPSGAGWVQLTYDLTGVATANDVREVGLKVALAGSAPSWSGTLHLDSVTY